jgi:hypothetical protein
MYVSVPFAPFPIQAIGPSGETWCVPNSSRYELLRVAQGRDTVRISRDVPRVPVTRAERDSIVASFEQKGPTGYDYGRIPATKPVIGAITIDGQGRPWIRRTNARGDISFDVFSPTGQFMATVEMGAGVRMPGAAPIVVRDQTLYTLVLDDDDVPYVVRYQIAGR